MKRELVVGVVCLALCACAGLSRTASYGNRLADAKTSVNGRAYSLWMHPTDDSILVQRGFGAAMGQSVVTGLSLNSLNLTEPKFYWRRAAETLTAPAGCTVTDVYSLDNRITWEAPFSCPPGVDLRAIVFKQRDQLRRGEPLMAAPPSAANTQAPAQASTSATAPVAAPVRPAPPIAPPRKPCKISSPTDPDSVTC